MALLSGYLFVRTITLIAVLRMFPADAARILMLNPYVGNTTTSHFLVMRKISQHLVSRGHDVTLAVSVHELTSVSSTDGEYVRFASAFTLEEWDNLIQPIRSANIKGNVNYFHLVHLLRIQQQGCEAMMADERFYNRLKNASFDIAVVDTIFTCGFLYARRLGLKFVVLEAAPQISSVFDTIDPFPLSYAPVMLSELSVKMNFFERFYNAFAYYRVNVGLGIMSQQFGYIGKKYGITKGETVAGIRRSAELYILNMDFAFEFPRPVPSNIILVGSIMSEPAQPLPSWFEKAVSSSKHGVVVVSFGSHKQSGSFSLFHESIIEGLSKLPQLIIWSSKTKPTNVIDNILFCDWIPQNDLLGHPNVKAFISHGGVNGLMEAVYHGVPTLVLPGGFDCVDNAMRIQSKGIGISLSPVDVTPDRIQSAISELINNKMYKNNALRFSAIMKDRLETPSQTASFWIEHVIRHGGGSHLRPAGNDLSFVERHMLDVQLTFLVVLLLIIYTFLLIIYSALCNVKSKFTLAFAPICPFAEMNARKSC